MLKKATIKKKTIKGLETELKKYMYPFIKKRDGNKCISCGKVITNPRAHHAGHFAKAELCNMEYRYKEENINSQCSYCNLYLRGNTLEYEKALLRKYGQETVQDIKDNYKRPLALDFDPREFLEYKIQYYKSKVS